MCGIVKLILPCEKVSTAVVVLLPVPVVWVRPCIIPPLPVAPFSISKLLSTGTDFWFPMMSEACFCFRMKPLGFYRYRSNLCEKILRFKNGWTYANVNCIVLYHRMKHEATSGQQQLQGVCMWKPLRVICIHCVENRSIRSLKVALLDPPAIVVGYIFPVFQLVYPAAWRIYFHCEYSETAKAFHGFFSQIQERDFHFNFIAGLKMRHILTAHYHLAFKRRAIVLTMVSSGLETTRDLVSSSESSLLEWSGAYARIGQLKDPLSA